MQTEFNRLEMVRLGINDPLTGQNNFQAPLKTRVTAFVDMLAKYDAPIPTDAAGRNMWRLSHEERFAAPSSSGYVTVSSDPNYVIGEIARYFGITERKESSRPYFQFGGVEETSRTYNSSIDGTTYSGSILRLGIWWRDNVYTDMNVYTVVLDVYGDVVYTQRENRFGKLFSHASSMSESFLADMMKRGVSSHMDKTYPLYIRDGYGPVRQALDVWTGNAGVVNRKRFSVDTVYEEYAVQIDSDGDGLNNWTEKDLGSNIYVKDSDGDGMDDGFEYKYGLQVMGSVNATSPQCSAPSSLYVKGVGPGNDMDCDGLTNQQESKLGSNPLKLDSDTDGMNDAEEVAKGRNPAVNEAAIMTIVQQLLLN